MGTPLQWTNMLTNMARDRHLHPAILRTCKTIFEEAASVLTQRNLFIYQSYHSLGSDRALPYTSNRNWDIILNQYRCPPDRSERSWDIIKTQYRCPPTYGLPRHITSRSHPIWHLEIRLDGENDYDVVMGVLNYVLAPHNMLRTLELEMWDIWSRQRLHRVLTKLAASPNRVAVNVRIFERSWTLDLQRGPDRLRKDIMEWNQTLERRYVETKPKLTTKQWGRLWKRGCYRARGWTLLPSIM